MGIINKILAGGNIRQIIEEETQLKEYKVDSINGLRWKDPLSSKYAGCVLVFDPEKNKSHSERPWFIRPFAFDCEVQVDGVTPQICGIFVELSYEANVHKRGIDALYLIPNDKFEKLLSVVNTESVDAAVKWIRDNCEKVNRKYKDVFDAREIFDRVNLD